MACLKVARHRDRIRENSTSTFRPGLCFNDFVIYKCLNRYRFEYKMCLTEGSTVSIETFGAGRDGSEMEGVAMWNFRENREHFKVRSCVLIQDIGCVFLWCIHRVKTVDAQWILFFISDLEMEPQRLIHDFFGSGKILTIEVIPPCTNDHNRRREY